MTTNVSFLNPTIPLLREAVESKLGHTIHSLEEIVDFTEKHLHSRISEITIRRLWGLRADGYTNVRRSTLDELARYVGHSNFDAFEQYIKTNHIESTFVPAARTISTSSLHEGDTVVIQWLPDRTCRMVYQGDNRFAITSVENSHHLRPGCTFTALSFAIHHPLQLIDLHFADSNEAPTSYAIATQHGLSTIDVIG